MRSGGCAQPEGELRRASPCPGKKPHQDDSRALRQRTSDIHTSLTRVYREITPRCCLKAPAKSLAMAGERRPRGRLRPVVHRHKFIKTRAQAGAAAERPAVRIPGGHLTRAPPSPPSPGRPQSPSRRGRRAPSASPARWRPPSRGPAGQKERDNPAPKAGCGLPCSRSSRGAGGSLQ